MPRQFKSMFSLLYIISNLYLFMLFAIQTNGEFKNKQFDLKKNREKLGMECRSLLQRRSALKNEILQLQEYLNVLSVSSYSLYLILKYFGFYSCVKFEHYLTHKYFIQYTSFPLPNAIFADQFHTILMKLFVLSVTVAKSIFISFPKTYNMTSAIQMVYILMY